VPESDVDKEVGKKPSRPTVVSFRCVGLALYARYRVSMSQLTRKNRIVVRALELPRLPHGTPTKYSYTTRRSRGGPHVFRLWPEMVTI